MELINRFRRKTKNGIERFFLLQLSYQYNLLPVNQSIYNPNLYYIDPRFLQLHGPVELLTELKIGHFTFQAQADYQIDPNGPVHEYDWSAR